MLSLSVFVHIYHAYASVMKFCAQIIKTETLNPLKNPPNPTAETLTLEKPPNLRNPNPKDPKKRVGGLPKGPSRPPPSPWLPPWPSLMASACTGLGPERPRSPAPATPTPRARHEAEGAGCRPDLKPAVAADVDLRAAGEVPLGHRRATLDEAACPRLRHAAPASGARRCHLLPPRRRGARRCSSPLRVVRSLAVAGRRERRGGRK